MLDLIQQSLDRDKPEHEAECVLEYKGQRS